MITIKHNKKKHSLEDMQRIAETHGGRCLSEIYRDVRTKLIWECSQGHKWESQPKHIINGQWCPQCFYEKRRLKIEDIQKIAQERGGKCLSQRYVNSNTKLKWKCSQGHQWEAKPGHVKKGHWCPKCAGVELLSIEEMHKIAKERNGKCLSDRYINSQTKLKWECALGHQWYATPGKIKIGRWCPKCGINKRTEAIKLDKDDIQKIAKERNGKCLSDIYINSRVKLKWECEFGHKWEAPLAQIKGGSWCPKCVNKAPLTLDEMHILAKQRGGECLSKEYIDTQTDIEWKCASGHTWFAIPNSIQRGTWCPYCSSGLGERICREFFEQIFEYKFPKSRPDWLRSPLGNKMELDGYCESLNLAFEHQGIQHYSEIKFFSKGENSLSKRKRYDQYKKILCQRNNIMLIEVPEIPILLKIDEVKPFIKNECINKGIPLPRNFEKKEINLRNAYSTNPAYEALEELKIVAEQHLGKCISNDYINISTKLEWECVQGHRWFSAPINIKSGNWCPECTGVMPLTIEEMKRMALERGGKCLSDIYINIHSKLLWECSKGHTWKAKPSKIKGGQWCPKCAGNIPLTIEEMQEIGFKRGGRCLSEKYINSQTKLKWKCANGHTWEAIPNQIRRGSWCPECAGLKPLTIEEMHKIARAKNGKCLSNSYNNSESILRWECFQGHKWDATPDKIKRGSWCPICAGNTKLSIEEMKKTAEERGGKCLSDSYINSQTKLSWQCSNGHTWEAIPNNIRRGSWCPICSKTRK